MTPYRKEIMCVYREREKEKGAQTRQNKTKQNKDLLAGQTVLVMSSFFLHQSVNEWMYVRIL